MNAVVDNVLSQIIRGLILPAPAALQPRSALLCIVRFSLPLYAYQLWIVFEACHRRLLDWSANCKKDIDFLGEIKGTQHI